MVVAAPTASCRKPSSCWEPAVMAIMVAVSAEVWVADPQVWVEPLLLAAAKKASAVLEVFERPEASPPEALKV